MQVTIYYTNGVVATVDDLKALSYDIRSGRNAISYMLVVKNRIYIYTKW